MDLREIQRRLAALRLYSGAADGIYGSRTHAAIDALFLARPYVRPGWRAWTRERRTVAAGQLICMLDGIEVGAIDGLIGPQTRHAFEVYAARQAGTRAVALATEWRDADVEAVRATEDGVAGGSPAARAPSSIWPRQSEADLLRHFGPIGANQTRLVLPDGYPMSLAWDPTHLVNSITCHEKVAAAARRVLVRALDHYGAEGVRALGLDRFGGCLSVRKMRGGSAWSTHAWGIAFDFDPDHNQLSWDHTRARFAAPEYEHWFALWEAEGFVSLGRARDYDWMHVQAARL